MNRFVTRKQNILAQLDTPDSEYQDLSPKGSVDAPIRHLIDEINALEGLVTTSSCSGRISVFLEGRKASKDDGAAEETGESRAGPGGKGGGGTWLFLSHEPVQALDADMPNFSSRFGLEQALISEASPPEMSSRYIHLKFEPMILHILTASIHHAQRVLTAALSAGFRESGAVSLSAAKDCGATPMVAIRSTGYSFDSIVGYQTKDGHNISLVDERYLSTIVSVANDRFRINGDRIARFRAALIVAFDSSLPSCGESLKPDWEDADARKRRKREEGLARQQMLQINSSVTDAVPKLDETDVGFVAGIFD